MGLAGDKGNLWLFDTHVGKAFNGGLGLRPYGLMFHRTCAALLPYRSDYITSTGCHRVYNRVVIDNLE